MSFLLANGLIEVVVPVGQKICLTSYGAGTTKVETETGPNNYPTAFSLLKLITNSDYTSPVFTKDTIVKITAGLCDVEYIVGINPFPTISRVTTDNNGSFLLDDNTVIDGNLSVSGLLGLGVTPSAWGGNSKAFEFPAAAIEGRATSQALSLFQNSYYDGTNSRYLTTNAAGAYAIVGSTHQWLTAPSGTAGNPITFTQAMALTSGGNLLVGTTMDSGAKLRVDNPSASTNDVAIFVTPDATAYLQIVRTGAAAQAATIAAASDSLRFGIDNATGRTERARITSNGNLLVGTTTDSGFRAVITSTSNLVRLDAQNATSTPFVGLRINSTGTSVGNVSPAIDFDVGGGGGGASIYTVREGGAGGNLILSTDTTGAVRTERARITAGGNQINFQPAESAQNTSATLTVSQLQSQIITANAAVTLTLPTGTALETYTTVMAVNTAFEVVFIATTANAITIDANGNTTVGSLTINGNTSGTFRFRKTAANTFTVYRTA